jgi:hypothetical protein
MIGISVYRPFHLLVTEPVVFFFSLWVAFAWAVLYLTFGSIPLVFGHSHGFTVQDSGAVFAAMCVGAMLSTVLSIYQDRLLARYLSFSAKNIEDPGRIRRAIDLSSPEGRLYFACIESALLPIGLFVNNLFLYFIPQAPYFHYPKGCFIRSALLHSLPEEIIC